MLRREKFVLEAAMQNKVRRRSKKQLKPAVQEQDELDLHLGGNPNCTECGADVGTCKHTRTIQVPPHALYTERQIFLKAQQKQQDKHSPTCIGSAEDVDASEPAQKGIGAAQIGDAKKALQFLLAGNALFTLRSKKTGERYTYKVRKAEPNPQYPNSTTWFVNLLTGPENTSDYTYLGIVRKNPVQNPEFRLTGKSKMRPDSPPVKAFQWTLGNLLAGALRSDRLEIWHAGRCGRCGRVLTVPESISSGFGPECINQL